MLQKILKKYFSIHAGESKIVLLMQFYIFLIITVLLLIKPTVSALFIHDLGAEKLPYGFLLVAVTAIFTSIFYNRMVKKFAIKFVATATIILFSALFFMLSYLIRQGLMEDWLLYFYYVILSLFGVLVTSQFWVIANIVFNIREAKRLFGFIGAGAIAGGILGGYLTSIVANYFGTEAVIALAATLLLGCLPIIFWIWKIRINRLNKFIKKKRVKKEESISGNSFSIVLKSKHLINISALVGVSVLVAKLVDYQFSFMAHKAYTNSDELASFFGFWYSSFNIVALVIQLFLTNRLLKRFRLTLNMLLLPLTLTLGSILFIVFPELWVVIFMKGVDTSFKQSINKASFELSILPVPYETKKQAKPFIDVVVDSVATGISGFLLIFVIEKLSVDPFYISIIVIFFLLVWFYLIYKIRRSYFNSFRENIKGVINTRKESLVGEENSISTTINVLKEGAEEEILVMLRYLKYHESDIFKPYILKLLNHPSDKIKAAAIRDIYNYNVDEARVKVKQLALQSNDEIVIYEAMEYLLLHTSDIEDKVYLSYLDNEKTQIKQIALLCLAKASRYNKELGAKFNLTERIKNKINELTQGKEKISKEEIAELLITIGYSGNTEFYFFIEKYLKSKKPELVIYAIKAAGFSHHEMFVNILLSFMNEDDYRKYAVKALQTYGEDIVQLLFEKDENQELSPEIRGCVPELVQIFKTKKSIVVLLQLLTSKEVLVRLNASKGLKNLEINNSKARISDKRLSDVFFKESHYFKNTLSYIKSLEKVNKKQTCKEFDEAVKKRTELVFYLKKQLDDSLSTIFNLLSIKYLDTDMEIAQKGITTETEESRINTVEFLSNILQSDLKKEFVPLLEYHFLSDTDNGIKIDSISETKCLLKILNERGVVTKILILQLISFLNKSPFIKKLELLSKHKNKEVRNLANTILNS